MNDKIYQLNLTAMSIVLNGDDPDNDIEQMYIPKEFTKKFAELIVRECINLVEPTEEHRAWAQGYLGGVDGLELLDSKVKKIKQNFGVGE